MNEQPSCESLTNLVRGVIMDDRFSEKSIRAATGHREEFMVRLATAHAEWSQARPLLEHKSRAHTRPFLSGLYDGENRGVASISAPIVRADLARKGLVYYHEVCLEDPVDWFLNHPYAEPFHNKGGITQLLESMAALAPLVDKGLVHFIAQDLGEDEVRADEAHALCIRAFGREATGPTVDQAYVLLRHVQERAKLGGAVDLYLPWGRELLAALQAAVERGEWVPLEAGLPKPIKAMVVVPDVSRLSTTDILSLRSSDAIGTWLACLSRAIESFEEAIEEQATGVYAQEQFRGELEDAAAGLRRELSTANLIGPAALATSRRFIVEAVGILTAIVLAGDVSAREIAGSAGIAVGEGGLSAWETLSRQRYRKPMAAHFDTFFS